MANKFHVIRWITTHEIKIIARVNLTAGARTVRALGPNPPPLLVFNNHITLGESFVRRAMDRNQSPLIGLALVREALELCIWHSCLHN
jgi:hypothetical protein